MNLRKFLLTVILSLVVSSVAFAQSISLYDQPDQNAKVVGTADLSSGIIPIYTPKEGAWIKVADPRNGNVGWVKMSDLKNTKGSGGMTITQKIITDGQQSTNFPIIQFGNAPVKLTNEQSQVIMQKMRTEQQAIQQSLEGIINNLNDLIKREWNLWNTQGPFPLVITPKETHPAAPVKQTQPAKK